MRGPIRAPRALAALAVCLAATAVHAQAQMRITVRWLYLFETVYVSDFTPGNTGSHPDLLGITLINGGGGSQQVVLSLSVTMERPRALQIFSGETAPFTVSGSMRQLTNRDLVQRGETEIVDYDVGSEAEDMQDLVTQTGRLPAGTYVFAVSVRTPQGVQLDEGVVRVELTNPTRVELLSPGRPVKEEPPLETSPAPRFLWSTDGTTPNAQYRLRVVRADGAGSAEEAMQGFAAWEETVATTSAVYPGSAAALKLEAGGTYAWQVTREVRTSGGVERIQSPIYWFRAGGTGQRTTTASADDAAALRMQELMRSLGLGAELAGFRPVGPLVADGRTLSLASLEELLAAIASGQLSLLSVRVR